MPIDPNTGLRTPGRPSAAEKEAEADERAARLANREQTWSKSKALAEQMKAAGMDRAVLKEISLYTALDLAARVMDGEWAFKDAGQAVQVLKFMVDLHRSESGEDPTLPVTVEERAARLTELSAKMAKLRNGGHERGVA